MRIGVISEFNPFHNGHKYLIDKAKEILLQNGGGEIISVMSEFFTQRGEAAIIDGYKRAECAVESGVDLVIALPYRASVCGSDDFSENAISILDKCKIDMLIFGSELDSDIFADIYKKEYSENIKEKVISLTKKGYSYPKIMAELFNLPSDIPNFILGYSYYKYIKKNAPHIKIKVVKREGQILNKKEMTDEKFLSATAIRKNVNNKNIKKYLSNKMYDYLINSNNISEEIFYKELKYKILSLGKKGLKDIYDISEGLENRIYEKNLISSSYEELIKNIKTKRYSEKRIKRILLHILLGATYSEMKQNINEVRGLCVKSEKTYLIREINKAGNIYIYQKLNKKNSKFFDFDIKVSRIYNIYYKEKDIFKRILRRA